MRIGTAEVCPWCLQKVTMGLEGALILLSLLVDDALRY
jgi:hypothetical protein